ncbi:hypothetical protein A2U01_0114262, partial [Trifolium medium]|nr:hypothetical protein [Trifolium medium]
SCVVRLSFGNQCRRNRKVAGFTSCPLKHGGFFKFQTRSRRSEGWKRVMLLDVGDEPSVRVGEA